MSISDGTVHCATRYVGGVDMLFLEGTSEHLKSLSSRPIKLYCSTRTVRAVPDSRLLRTPSEDSLMALGFYPSRADQLR